MRKLCVAMLTGCLLLPAATGWSQLGRQESAAGAELGAERTQRWKVGMTISALQGPCVGIYGTIPVPTNWPEQDVKVVEEQISDSIRQVRYRDLDGGVRQMLVAVARLDRGEKAEALVTFEVTRRAILLPEDTSIYQVPQKIPRDVRRCLASSPYIDTRNRKIRDTAKEITADKQGGWEKVEAIHDWVKENVEQTNDQLKGSLNTLREKKGNHEDMAGLFIALCRAEKIPARTVWVPDYCYAEFYLEDENREGHWFPCELREKTVFGTVSNDHMIIQKGDNIAVPEKKEPQRFVAEFLKGKSGPGLGRPTVSFVRQVLPGR